MSGLYDFLGCDWGNGNTWWKIWDCSPCCGDPWNPIDAAYCFICFMCPPCALCTYSHICAEDLEQNCAICNHSLPICILTVSEIPCSVCSCIRHNRRVRSFEGGMDPGCPGKIGDVIMTCPPCLPCSLCQICRSMDRKQWNWPAKLNKTRPILCPFKMDAERP